MKRYVIYTITNPASEVYVGATSDFKSRVHHHRRDLRNRRGVNAKLQASWDKYGKHGHIFRQAASVVSGPPEETERDVIESLGAELNVNAKPGPLGCSEPRGRPYGPYLTVAAFARANSLELRYGKYLSQRYSYEAALAKLAWDAKPPPPQVPKPPRELFCGPRRPDWVVDFNGTADSPRRLARHFGIGQDLFDKRVKAGMTHLEVIAAGPYDPHASRRRLTH